MSGGITSGSFTASLLLALLACCCWGSWSNFFKTANSTNVPFTIFYIDFSLSILLVAAVAFVSLGEFSLCKNDKTNMEHVIYGVLSGVVFNGGNVLLIYGIETVGLAVAFPVAVGLGLVGGTILTYLVDPKGVDEVLLFSGVALAFVAVLFNAYASGRMDKAKRKGSEYDFISPINSTPKDTNFGISLIACVMSGVFLTGYPTLSAFAAKTDHGLGPYGLSLISNGSVLVTTLIATVLASCFRPDVSLKSYCSCDYKNHAWGFLGGLVWAIGSLSFTISGDGIGFAISYSIGQSAPLVATLWGVFYYREFMDADLIAQICVGVMVILYIGAILLIAKSS